MAQNAISGPTPIPRLDHPKQKIAIQASATISAGPLRAVADINEDEATYENQQGRRFPRIATRRYRRLTLR
jgi:hypothetical protein